MRARPNQNRRLDLPHNINQPQRILLGRLPLPPNDLLWVPGIVFLPRSEVRIRLEQEPVGVDAPESFVRFFPSETVDVYHGFADLVDYAEAGGPNAVEDDARVGELGASDVDGGHQGCEGDCAGACRVEC